LLRSARNDEKVTVLPTRPPSSTQARASAGAIFLTYGHEPWTMCPGWAKRHPGDTIFAIWRIPACRWRSSGLL